MRISHHFRKTSLPESWESVIRHFLDFVKNAPTNEQAAFWDCFARTADKLGVQCEFNCLANAGTNAPFIKQSVFHFHLHLVAGAKTSAFKNLISEIEQ